MLKIFCVIYWQTCILQTGTESLSPCIKFSFYFDWIAEVYCLYYLHITYILSKNIGIQLLTLPRHAFHCQCNVFIISLQATFSHLVVSNLPLRFLHKYPQVKVRSQKQIKNRPKQNIVSYSVIKNLEWTIFSHWTNVSHFNLLTSILPQSGRLIVYVIS